MKIIRPAQFDLVLLKHRLVIDSGVFAVEKFFRADNRPCTFGDNGIETAVDGYEIGMMLEA